MNLMMSLVQIVQKILMYYDSSSDFYTNQGTNIPIPSPEIGRTSITSLGSGTYSVEPSITTVNVLVVGGGGGGSGGYNGTKGGGAGLVV